MSLADAMNHLTHDLASSTAARLQGVEQLRVETSELLTDARNLVSRFHMENEEQAAALRNTLQEFRSALEKEVKHTRANFHREHQQMAKELQDTLNKFRHALETGVKHTLGNFHKHHQQMAKELRATLNEFRQTLETEVKTTLNEFRDTTLAENAADCREAHDIWMSRPTARPEPGRPRERGSLEMAAKPPKPAKARKKSKAR